MSSLLFLKRVFLNKVYWLSVMAALFLLMCSIVYTDFSSGKEYLFIAFFYDDVMKTALESGSISMEGILMGYDTGYLWMFCPIITGIPCIILKKTERFFLFRTSKNRYLISKYCVSILSGGGIMFFAYLAYMLMVMMLINENLWNVYLIRKLLSVFLWGILSALPGILLSEIMENKYLILCIPFVLNYFMYIFVGKIITYEVWQYISPSTYQIIFLYDKKMVIPCLTICIVLILVGVILKKVAMERRCDCGV